MSFFRRLFGRSEAPTRDRGNARNRDAGRSAVSSPIGQQARSAVDAGFRKCRIETMEDRRVLAASPLIVGAVYIEGDGGTDAEPDQFYISFEGGSPTTSVTRIVIDGNQDGSPTLGDTDVYFDITPSTDPGNILGVGDAHDFQWSNKSVGVSAGEVTATVIDGGTRLVLDLVNFEAGDVLAFTIDVDQYFSTKPDDQVTSGIEFAGSSLEITAFDSDYTFNPDPTTSFGTFAYSFDFGSDDVADTGVLSGLPSQFNRTTGNGLNSIENRTAGARKDFALEPRPVSLSGYVGLTDENGNCVDPLSTSHRGVENVLITARDGAGNEYTTRTNADGYYEFRDLPPGTYTIIETQPADLLDGEESVGKVNGLTNGSLGSNDQFVNIVLQPGDDGVLYDFCEHEPAAIEGTVYFDRNDNGVQDAGEPGISGVTVELFDDAGNLVATTTTGSQGEYAFENLLAGTYTVFETQPATYIDGQDSVGRINGVITGSKTNDRISSIVLKTGQWGIEYNFGELRGAILEGRVHTDLNDDCVLDAGTGEVPLAGVVIQLLDSSLNVVDEVRTDSEGRYRFEGLRPGTYSVRQVQPGDYFTAGETIGRFNVTGSNGDGTVSENLISDITILSGAHMVDYNFCEAPAATISGYVFQDGSAIVLRPGQTLTPQEARQLRDGRLTSDDQRIGGVVLELRNGITGVPISADQALPGRYASGPIRVTTDANGFYQFTGLRQGNYAVFEIQPAGYQDHIDTEGTNQGIPVNPTDSIDPFVLSTLAAGVDPANDAILRIAVNWGDDAQLNNFSEITTTTLPNIPRPPSTPRTPVRQFGRAFVPGGMVRGGGGSAPEIVVAGLAAPPSGSAGYTWHLSVINAGAPRGEHGVVTQWQGVSYLSESEWSQVNMNRGRWLITRTDTESITGSPATDQLVFGMDGGIPLAGDFDGDGTDELLMYRNGLWFVDINGNHQWDRGDLWAELGTASDLPVVGDWDGDGKDDIGIYGPQWKNDLKAIEMDPGLPDLANQLTGEAKNLPPKREYAADGIRKLKLKANGQVRGDLIDHVFRYGSDQELPVTGDWNGDGVRNIGTYVAGTWKLDVDGDGRLTDADEVRKFGREGDLPVVGDFDGDGVEQIGVFRDGQWIIDSNNNGEIDVTDKVFEMGSKGDIPVVGDFDGDGKDEPAIYQMQRPEVQQNDVSAASADGRRQAG